jgi:pimeloyl-ACP methyl ester carboxylesterase
MRCDVGDVALYYATYGAGRPIVLLPGRPSDHWVMARFMEPLCAQRNGWQRLYPDLPAAGRTAHGPDERDADPACGDPPPGLLLRRPAVDA